jgi:hypothetical protein
MNAFDQISAEPYRQAISTSEFYRLLSTTEKDELFALNKLI